MPGLLLTVPSGQVWEEERGRTVKFVRRSGHWGNAFDGEPQIDLEGDLEDLQASGFTITRVYVEHCHIDRCKVPVYYIEYSDRRKS